MRLKHRIRVVQELEDTCERNIIKSIIGDGYLTMPELKELLSLVREEYLSQNRKMPEKHDSGLQPYEGLKIDYDYFKLLFAAITPWGRGSQSESLSARIFAVRYL